ncbi:regulator of Ty1 transposition [Scheffersomyces amazonensis]|uniref:regulator of Ty1 transposition n=1 Tax=Scheffersomyces amazonensis TaxID=1078765 RepID=UPI00315CF27E
MSSLKDLLGSQLPKECKFKLLHIQTRPTYIKSPIHLEKTEASKVDTVKIRHLIQLIDSEDLIVFGIEIYVYLLINDVSNTVHQIIFVSKCDTVGLVKHEGVKIGELVKVILQWLIEYNINDYGIKKRKEKKIHTHVSIEGNSDDNDTIISIKKLIHKLQSTPNYYSSLPYYNSKPSTRPTKPSHLRILPTRQIIRVCLFTKAADQYIYPYSSKNPHKHIINGAQLLKWWLRTIDKTLTAGWDCKLMIPGSDETSSRKFLTDLAKSWSLGHVYKKHSDNSDTAIYCIPVYPDDPKGRFLEHLIVENRYQRMTVGQFYQELGFRQEFRLGNVVGLIGCQSQTMNISPSTNFNENEDERIVMTIHQYKQLVNNVIKGESFTKKSDIQNLVVDKIPIFIHTKLSKDEDSVIYQEIEGNRINIEVPKVEKTAQPVVVNTLSVKRKAPTDLTNLVRRKK